MAVQHASGATRERLLRAAEAVFAERGFTRATVDDIVSLAGISKGAFYVHFPSKEAIFLALLDRMGQLLDKAIAGGLEEGQGPEDTLRRVICGALRVFEGHRSLAYLSLVGAEEAGPQARARAAHIRKAFRQLAESNVRRLVSEGKIPPVYAPVAAAALFGTLAEVVHLWLTGEEPALSAVAEEVVAVSLRALGLNLHREDGSC